MAPHTRHSQGILAPPSPTDTLIQRLLTRQVPSPPASPPASPTAKVTEAKVAATATSKVHKLKLSLRHPTALPGSVVQRFRSAPVVRTPKERAKVTTHQDPRSEDEPDNSVAARSGESQKQYICRVTRRDPKAISAAPHSAVKPPHTFKVLSENYRRRSPQRGSIHFRTRGDASPDPPVRIYNSRAVMHFSTQISDGGPVHYGKHSKIRIAERRMTGLRADESNANIRTANTATTKVKKGLSLKIRTGNTNAIRGHIRTSPVAPERPKSSPINKADKTSSSPHISRSTANDKTSSSSHTSYSPPTVMICGSDTNITTNHVVTSDRFTYHASSTNHTIRLGSPAIRKHCTSMDSHFLNNRNYISTPRSARKPRTTTNKKRHRRAVSSESEFDALSPWGDQEDTVLGSW